MTTIISTIDSTLSANTPHFKLPTTPAGVVLRRIRLSGSLHRDQIVQETGLSSATVNRGVSALLEAGLIVERATVPNAPSVGRPRMSVELNPLGPVTLGVHIGSKASSISIYDTAMRMLNTITVPRNEGTSIARSVSEAINTIRSQWKNRTFVRIGIAIGGTIDPKGLVTNPELGLDSAPLAGRISTLTGLRTTIAPLVEALAAAELQQLSDTQAQETTLYFYAHETIGTAMIVSGAVRTARSGQTTVGQLPYKLLPFVSEKPPIVLDPSNSGKFEDAVSESSILAAAQAKGLSAPSIEAISKLAASGNNIAQDILHERASLLGAGVSLVSDISNPDRIVLGGQGFTDNPQLLPLIAKEIASRTYGIRRPIHITGAKQFTQQRAAAAVALDRLFFDPIAETRLRQPRSVRAA